MPIPTSRTKEKGTIVIHQELCIGCGKCVSVLMESKDRLLLSIL